MKFRTIVERLSREKTFKRNIKIGTRRAPIIVSPDAQLKYLKLGTNPFDQDLIKIARFCLEPTDNVWDIGANIGVFTIAAAVCGKSVVSVEADAWLVAILRRSAGLSENSELNIKVIPAAVSQRNGVAEFQIASRGRASNALTEAGGRSQMGGVREKVHVVTLCLDTLADELGVPDFIKIDVEGAEWMVIKGGYKLFYENQPIVYVEIGANVREEIFNFFESKGYKCYSPTGQMIVTAEELSPNVFFAHEEHLPRLERLRDSFS